jgi:YD repeat-containing protein
MAKGKEIVKLHTDKDGKVYRLTYDVNGVLICVEHLY